MSTSDGYGVEGVLWVVLAIFGIAMLGLRVVEYVALCDFKCGNRSVRSRRPNNNDTIDNNNDMGGPSKIEKIQDLVHVHNWSDVIRRNSKATEETNVSLLDEDSKSTHNPNDDDDDKNSMNDQCCVDNHPSISGVSSNNISCQDEETCLTGAGIANTSPMPQQDHNNIISRQSSCLSSSCNTESDIGCAICLARFSAKDVVCQSKNMACTHVYHLTCMAEWLSSKHNQCPMCRQDYIIYAPTKILISDNV